MEYQLSLVQVLATYIHALCGLLATSVDAP